MATSYLRAENIKEGQSAVAAAAYRSGEKLVDQQYGRIKNYKGKTTEVVFDKVYLPEQAPEEFSDKENLWNAAQWAELNTQPDENGERTLRHGARFAKAYTIAIPNEMTLEQEQAAMEEVAAFFTSQGYGVQIDLHHPDIKKKNAKNKSRVKSKENHHAHLLVTARKINGTGFDLTAPKQKKDYVYVLDRDGNKVPELDKDGKPKLNQRKQPVYKRVPLLDENGNQRYRERKGKGREPLWATQTIEVNWLDDSQTLANFKDCWAEICNQALEQEKVSFHTHEKIAETKDLKPEFYLQPQIHVGAAAWSMLQKGIEGIDNERATANENIKAENREKLAILDITQEQWQKQAEQPEIRMYKIETARPTMQTKLAAAKEENSQKTKTALIALSGFAKKIPELKLSQGVYRNQAEAKQKELYQEFLSAKKMLDDWCREHISKPLSIIGFNYILYDNDDEKKEHIQHEKLKKEAYEAYQNYDIDSAVKELYESEMRQINYATSKADSLKRTYPLEEYISHEIATTPVLQTDPEYQKLQTLADKHKVLMNESGNLLSSLKNEASNLEVYERLYNIRKAPLKPKTYKELYLTYAKRQLDQGKLTIDDSKVISDILSEKNLAGLEQIYKFTGVVLHNSPNYIQEITDTIKEKAFNMVKDVFERFIEPQKQPKEQRKEMSLKETWDIYNQSLKKKKEQKQQNQPNQNNHGKTR